MYHTYSKGGGGRGTYCSYLLYYYKIFLGEVRAIAPFGSASIIEIVGPFHVQIPRK